MEPINKFISGVLGGALLLGATACLPRATPVEIPTVVVSETFTATVGIPISTSTNTLSPTPIATTTASPTPGPLRLANFGAEMFQINSAGGLNQMAAAKTSWVRRNAVIWSSIEPINPNGETPSYNWSSMAGLETELKNAYNNGMQVILIVRSTPGWARKDLNTAAGTSCGPIAQNKWAAFGTFMNALVARYSVAPYNVKYWELWNEEDAPYKSGDDLWGCWGDTSDANYGGGYYAGMLQVAYPQIKAADPQAKVLIGGLLLDCDPRPGAGCAIVGHDAKQSLFLEGILKTSNIGSFFDGISFHSYDYYQGWAGFYSNKNWLSSGLANAANTQDWATTIGPVSIAKAQYITSLLSEYDVSGKFLMNTKLALLCDACGGDPTFENIKAYYIAQVYAAAIAQGLRGEHLVCRFRLAQLGTPQ